MVDLLRMPIDRRHILRSSLGLFVAGLGGGHALAQSSAGAGSGGVFEGELSASLYKEVPDNVAYMIALDQGYFKKRGLGLTPVSYRRGSDAIRGTARSGFGSTSALSGILAYAQGLSEIRIVGTNLSATTNVFLVPADSPVKSPEDLKGKKLGVLSPTTSVQITALQMLKDAGLEPGKDVELIDVKGGPEAIVAMKNGIVDAGFSSPPLSVELVQKGEFRLLYEGVEHPPALVNTALFTTASMLEKNPEVVGQWVAAIADAHKFLKENIPAAGAIYARESGVSEAVATATIARYESKFQIGMSKELYDSQVGAARALGLLDKDIPYEEIVVPDYYLAAEKA